LIAKQAASFWAEGTYTYYSLDGKAKSLNFGEAYGVYAAPGGRFAEVRTGDYPNGLFDLQANAWAIAPKEGQMIYTESSWGVQPNTVLLGNGQLYYDCQTGEQVIIPAELGLLQGYISELQWHCFNENGVRHWYDKSFNHMPQLDSWSIRRFTGKYALMVSETARGYALLDRDGNTTLVENEKWYRADYQWAGFYCYSTTTENGQNIVLVDSELNPIFEAEPGEKIIEIDGPMKGYVLLCEDGQVKASCDAYGKPLPVLDRTYVMGAWMQRLLDEQWFLLKDGVLRALPDMSAYSLNYYLDYDGFGGEFQKAKVVSAFEDFILIGGWQNLTEKKQEKYIDPTLFAIDWDGNLYPNCPLEPFFSSVNFARTSEIVFDSFRWPTAGEQGPNYFWVERNGLRGYINTKGEWLFIDPHRI